MTESRQRPHLSILAWLQGRLARGWSPSDAVRAEAERAGYRLDVLKWARQMLGVLESRAGVGHQYWWALPGVTAPDPFGHHTPRPSEPPPVLSEAPGPPKGELMTQTQTKKSKPMPAGRMPFGRYRGRLLSDLPLHYLGWLESIELREPLRAQVEAELDRRSSTLIAEREELKAKVEALTAENKVLREQVFALEERNAQLQYRVTPGQEAEDLGVLSLIKELGEARTGDLMSRLDLTRHKVWKIVRRLERAGKVSVGKEEHWEPDGRHWPQLVVRPRGKEAS